MTARRWSNVSYLDAIRPDPGWRTDYAFLASYSADLVALAAALLALAGLDDDRGSGSKVDFANAIEQLADRVRLVAQAGRLVAPAKTPKILVILDRFVREVSRDEKDASWHPKIALTKQFADDGKSSQWRLWIGSRNLTRDLSWDVGITLSGYPGGSGTEVAGIPELGHELAHRARLPGVYASAVRSELRKMRWHAPPGCVIKSLRLLDEDTSRGLPASPPNIRKLIVVSPFLDGAIVRDLGKWGSSETQRILISSRAELAKLATQQGNPLSGFQELLFLDAPISDEHSANDVVDRENASSQDEEPEPRGLHAKIIFAESPSQRLLWTGSANATQRGWNGPNTEVVTELSVTPDIAAGLDDFIKSARTVQRDELKEVIEANQVDEQLEEARKQVASSWDVNQQCDAEGRFLSSATDPNPAAPEVTLSVGLLGAEQVPWPRETTTVRLPQVAASEVTEFVCCRLALGDSSISWLQRAPMDPPPGDERDRQALARYLKPRFFLMWIRSLLTGDAGGEGGGDWDKDDDPPPPRRVSISAPNWWAPTIEEVLKAWSRDPASLALIDKKVRHYLKLYEEQIDVEQTVEERAVVAEFHCVWQILRQELVLEAT